MKNILNIFMLLAVLLATTTHAQSEHQHHAHHSHDSSHGSHYTPLGVMSGHMHKAGEWMASYRYMRMSMQGNLVGDNSISAQDIVGNMMNPGQFMVAPTKMPMDMHMVGVMYAPTDTLTIMGMVQFVSNEMDHITRMGGQFSTESSGLGDSKVTALGQLFNSDDGRHRVHWGLGLSLPTGATDERDDIPVMDDAILPYPMQLGSGTYDLLPSLTYLGHQAAWSWGTQLSTAFRLDDNDEGYTLGDRVALTSWFAHAVNENFSASIRFNYQDWDNIDGQNDALNPMLVQTANTNLQAGSRLDVLLGASYVFTAGSFNGHRLSIEYGEDLHQDLDGPQLKTDSVLTLGWQKAF